MSDIASQRITQARDERTTSLSLANLDLRQVPELLWSLTHLTHLDISGNGVESLPMEIGNLFNLNQLNLSRNELESLPEAVKNLSNLTNLDLSGNWLELVPEPVEFLTNLTDLDLSFSRLGSVPEFIGNLTNLTDLDLSGNQLGSVPEFIGNLTNLTDLDLSHSRLGSVPEFIGNLTNLTALNLSGNQLRSVPEPIGNLTNLTALNLSGNQLRSVPEPIGNLTNLTALNLSGNQLRSVPEFIGKLTNLELLSLGGNGLGSVPEFIGKLTNLTDLNLSGNGLGSVPEFIGKLTNLTDLNLSSNQLGSVPEPIGKLTNLTDLNLSSNQLGSVPEPIGKLTNLTDLDLSHSRLGSVPEFIGNLTNLTDLNLSGNGLGSVPEFIGNLTNLTDLDLSHSRLGSVPEFIGNLTNLTALNLSGNQLRSVPEPIGKLTNLELLSLGSNQLRSVPEFIGNLTNLEYLGLAGNTLKAVPGPVGNLTSLTSLSLDGNDLRSIPEFIGNLTNLRYLGISKNRLQSLPESIGALAHLADLELSNNELASLPESLGGLQNLRILDLARNSLSSLPDSFANLRRLLELGLSDNRFVSIPEMIAHFPRLYSINLQRNPLAPELVAVVSQGMTATHSLIRDLAADGKSIRQAKLILLGEGTVGKTSLLSAMLGEEFVKNRETTHGVEVRPLLLNSEDDDPTTLNAWDFGGQKDYRPTHQFYFTSPAIYIVAWNPRAGASAGFVEEWINLVRRRVGDQVRIHIVATHSNPQGQDGDLDEQRLRREHGQCIAGFHRVDSETPSGITELKAALAKTAHKLPYLERRWPRRWFEFLTELNNCGTPYLDYSDYLDQAKSHGIDAGTAGILARAASELGHWCYYPEVDRLRDLVVLQGDWLSRAVSFILNDPATKDRGGLVTHKRLTALWNDPARSPAHRYPAALHEALRLLMHEYQIAYDVQNPVRGAEPTTLISQLVPSAEPALPEWDDYEPELPQLTHVVEFRDANYKEALPEGLMYHLITRFHMYSLGRKDHALSRHWARGLVLDKGYHGRALIRIVGDRVIVTVKAALPSFLSKLIVHEIAEYFSDWEGLTPTCKVKCGDRCASPSHPRAGEGAFEIDQLHQRRREGKTEAGCGECYDLMSIDSLISDATPTLAAKGEALQEVVEDMNARFDDLVARIEREHLHTREVVATRATDTQKRLLTEIDAQMERFLRLFEDEAKNGPQLFTVEHVGGGVKSIAKRRLRVVLWCEHSRLPVHVLEGDPDRGVYTVEVDQNWLVKARPWIGFGARLLRLAAGVGPALVGLNLDNAQEQALAERLRLAESSAKALSDEGMDLGGRSPDARGLHGQSPLYEPSRGQLTALHALLAREDPDFAGLKRVRDLNRYRWVHPRFAEHYR